jgi:polyhydroxybutyrate depolymerase
VTRQNWTDCREGAGVALVTIAGGGHAWPGAAPPRRRGADVPSREIDASKEIWEFFRRHAKR